MGRAAKCYKLLKEITNNGVELAESSRRSTRLEKRAGEKEKNSNCIYTALL